MKRKKKSLVGWIPKSLYNDFSFNEIYHFTGGTTVTGCDLRTIMSFPVKGSAYDKKVRITIEEVR